ncbi:amidohydrolase family protein [Actinomycetota bacterium]
MENKIIDIHVHIFPDFMSGKAMERLENKYKLSFIAKPNLNDLLVFMDSNNISFSIIQPVSTSVLQVEVLNSWLIDTIKKNPERIGAFGTIFPGYKDFKSELARVKEGGLKGIKFHPNFQQFYPDEERMHEVYKEIIDNDLWVLFHAGDEVTPVNKLYANIDSFVRLRRKFPQMKIILAHLGGFRLWDEVIEKIIKDDFYLDLSYTFGFLEESRIRDIIEEHGPDKIFFGTDFPLPKSKINIKAFSGLRLNNNIKDRIFYRNSLERLLEG